MNKKSLTTLKCVSAIVLAFSSLNTAWAISDGPRAYFPMPEGSDIATFMYIHGKGDLQEVTDVVNESKGKLDLGFAQYTHVFNVANHPVAGFIIVPAGRIKMSATVGQKDLDVSDSGMADLIFGGAVGLVGVPSLKPQDYVTYKPSFNLAAMTKISAPTGSYSKDNKINLGTNRWTYMFGLPMSYYFGKSLVDPKLTSLELLPSVTYFGHDSNAPERSQKPVYKLEGHVTQGINKMVWVSLDGIYARGGETKDHGVGNNNLQSSFGMGTSVNLTFSRHASLKLSYGKTVSHNENYTPGWMTRAIFNYVF